MPPSILMWPTSRAAIPRSPSTTMTMPSLICGMLDADAEGPDWREVVLIVPHINPDQEPVDLVTKKRAATLPLKQELSEPRATRVRVSEIETTR